MPNIPYVNAKQHEGFQVEKAKSFCNAEKKYKCTLNASCGVKWNLRASKFICECHGCEYDLTGKVTKGPAVEDIRCP